MTNEKQKLTDRGIQILRIIACLAVFFCHFGQRLKLGRFSANLLNFSQLGRYGVELFFVVSGYLVCFSLLNGKSAIQFYKKRIIRILPLYYFSILVFFITESFVFRDVPKDDMHLGWLRYIFCLNGIVPSEGYFWSNIGITWTIPVFLMFYILAPFFIRIK
ncbi:MAG: acyltransferase [Ruminococcus sp.]|nr:acyltransferase [Ruminococcus sp.]